MHIRCSRTTAICWLPLLVLPPILAGCTGEDENTPGMLAVDQALRNPQAFLAFVKLGMAVKIAECHFTPDQARALAEVAEAQGPAIRADVDAALAEANTAAAKLSSVADSVVTAEDPEEAVGQAMMELMAGTPAPPGGEGPPPGAAPVDAFAERIFGMFAPEGEGAGIGPVLDKHAAAVEAILATMSGEQRVAAGGASDGVERVLSMYSTGLPPDEAAFEKGAPMEPMGPPDEAEPADAEELEGVGEAGDEGPPEGDIAADKMAMKKAGMKMKMQGMGDGEPIDPILACTHAVLRELGYEDPEAEPWAVEIAQPIVEEFMALPDDERSAQEGAFATRLAAEISGDTEQLAQRVRRTLLAIAGYQDSPELLAKVAAR